MLVCARNLATLGKNAPPRELQNSTLPELFLQRLLSVRSQVPVFAWRNSMEKRIPGLSKENLQRKGLIFAPSGGLPKRYEKVQKFAQICEIR